MKKMIAYCGLDCGGCRMDGSKTPYCDKLCAIRQCALKKNVTTCGECSDVENCSVVGMIIANNPTALENLKG